MSETGKGETRSGADHGKAPRRVYDLADRPLEFCSILYENA